MKNFLLAIFLFVVYSSTAQSKNANKWRITMNRNDGKQIVFLLERTLIKGKPVLYVVNADEKIKITDVKKVKDSIFFAMPAFEAGFRLKEHGNGNLSGTFIKYTSGNPQYWPVYGKVNDKVRFKVNQGSANKNISGKWNVSITRPNGTIRKALAVFNQTGNKLTGSFLTPSSDYRYLDGIVTGDSLKLSSFDGDNARLFEASIEEDGNTINGVFYNGFSGKESFTAQKDASVALPTISDPTKLREGQTRLNFTFADLEGKMVSINDKKFENKVVIIQVFGSWCANCLDETRFLSEYYKQNKDKGIEVIALAYEYTTDIERSKKSVDKFKKLYDVPYPMLITGVTAGDDFKAEKTLPQLTAIKSFPTTIFIDKKGNVADIHTNFYGPGSGAYHELSKQKFIDTVERLVNK